MNLWSSKEMTLARFRLRYWKRLLEAGDTSERVLYMYNKYWVELEALREAAPKRETKPKKVRQHGSRIGRPGKRMVPLPDPQSFSVEFF